MRTNLTDSDARNAVVRICIAREDSISEGALEKFLTAFGLI